MSGDCLKFFVGPSCGWFGDCVEGACTCRNNWNKSTEMSSYFLSPSQVSQDGFCNHNPSLDISLYSICLGLSVICLVWQMRYIRTLDRLKRVSAFLVSLILGIIVSIYKLARVDSALVCDDIFFSVLICALFFATLTTTLFFYQRYLQYLVKSVHSPKAVSRGEFFQKLLLWLIPFDLVTLALLPASAAVAKNYDDMNSSFHGKIMFKLSMAMILVRTITLMILSIIIYSYFMTDLLMLKDFYQKNPTTLHAWPDATKSIDKAIRSMKVMRIVLWVLQGYWLVGSFLFLAFDFWMYEVFPPAVPVFEIVWLLVNIVAIIPPKRNAKKDTVILLPSK